MDSQRKSILAWAFYDWANSAFATTVMAGFFPLFFKQYWSAGSDASESTLQLGLANGTASLLIMLSAPVLGALADRAGARKRFLLGFAAVGIAMTGALHFVAQGAWPWAVALYVGASLGFLGGNIFYDALIVSVAKPAERDRVSALGYALGYLGGGLLFGFNVAMTLQPGTFGLESAAEAIRWSFAMVAAWWALFALPLFLVVKEAKPTIPPASVSRAVRDALRELAQTFHHLRKLRHTFLFLLAYWFYIDGVDTIVFMAVDYGLALGLAANSLITALLITQFVGFPAAIAFGHIARHFSAKTGIFLAIAIYIGVVIWAYRMESEAEFYGLAVAVGLVQGGVQALSRSLYSCLIPQDKAGQFFGFYNMLGKFAAVLGPVLVGTVSVMTGDPRLSILAVTILLVGGAVCLYFVNVEAAQAALRNQEKEPR